MSGIAKRSVDGPVQVDRIGLAGDEQADPRAHGGMAKAVYAYPHEHYPFWETVRAQTGAATWGDRLPHGALGENLTLAGLLEHDAHIGDTYTLGDDGAVVQVSQPRGPCYKVGVRWSSKTLVRLMGQELRAGFYFRVLEAGTVGLGDTLTLTDRVSDVSVAEVLRVTYRDRHDAAALRHVHAVPELAAQWRRALDQLLTRA